MAEIPAQPKIKHKTFTYRTHLSWNEKRQGDVASEGKPSVRVSSPPEFKGEAGMWTPEDLFVAAAILDHLLHHSYPFLINGKSYRMKQIVIPN